MKKTMLWPAILITLCTILATLPSGCTAVRKAAVDISAEEVENAVSVRTIALNYLAIWPLQSGFIKGSLGPKMDELPVEAVDAINELDKLAAQHGELADPNEWQDYDFGLSLGLRVRLLSAVVGKTLELYVPNTLKFVPFVY